MQTELSARTGRTIVGRDEELRAIDGFVRAPGTNKALLFEGLAGSGKTTLWSEAVARLAPDVTVLSCRPVENDIGLTFAGLHDLTAPLLDRYLPALSEPRRSALRVALLLDEPEPGSSVEGLAVPLAVTDLLRAAAEQTPVAIAIDDLQWLDRATSSVLEFCLRRLRDENVALIAAQRTREASHLEPTRVLDQHAILRIELGGLSPGALHHLVRLELGGPLTRPQLARVHEASGGLPFFALEIARSLPRVMGEMRPGSPLPLPPRLRTLVEGRLAELPEAARFALGAVAASGRRSRNELGRAFGEEVESAIAEGSERDLLILDGDRVEFTHPLWRSHAYALLDPADRQRIHLSLADVSEDIEDRARHLFLAAYAPDEGVAVHLEDASERAARRGALVAAAELMEMSVAVTPPANADGARVRALKAIDHHFAAGDPREARASLEKMLDQTPAGPHRSDILWRLGVAVSRIENPWTSGPVFERALDEAGDDARRRVWIEQWIAFTKVPAGDFTGSREHALMALELARELDDPVMEGIAMLHHSAASFILGSGYDPEPWERSIALVQDEEARLPFEWQPSAWHSMALKWSDALDKARPLILEGVRRLEARGDEAALPIALHHAAEIDAWAGRWDEALQHADRACVIAEDSRQDTVRCFALYAKGLVHAYRGDVDDAVAAAEEGYRLAEKTMTGPGLLLNASVLGFVELSLDRMAECAQRFGPLVQIAEASGTGEPSVFKFVPDAIEAFIATGDIAQAKAVLERLEERGRALQRTWALATAGRCRALLLAHEGDLQGAARAAVESLEHHERLPMPLERARTLLVAGQIERRLKHKAAARAHLEQAVDTLKSLGASLWLRKATDELARTGLRDATGSDLTPTEQRVAELVAAGKTNREVAETLFVSPKTIEVNLSRIYRKLDIRSRTELAARFAERSSK